jgi:hypothetical protein
MPEGIKPELDDLATFVSGMMNVNMGSNDANELFDRIRGLCALFDEENASNILNAFEQEYLTMQDIIKNEIWNVIDQSQYLLDYQTDKRNLISDIVTVAIDNIHGYIHERNLNFYAYNHEVTLYALEEYSKTNDINGISFSLQQKKTLKKLFGSEKQWKESILDFYNSVYDEVAEIYHIKKQDLIQLQMVKRRRNELSHLNSFMRSHGNNYFKNYFPPHVKK